MPQGLIAKTILFASLTTMLLDGASSTLLKPVSPLGATASVPTELVGVWRQIGYGRIIVVHANGYDLYHTTDLLCYRDPAGIALPLSGRYSLYQRDSQSDQLALYFHDLGPATTLYSNRDRFTRLGNLPSNCVSNLDRPEYRSPPFVFDLFWQTFREQYAFFEQRSMDWDAIRTVYRPRVRKDMSADELFALMKETLEPLNDGHVHLYLGTRKHFQAGDNIVSKRLRESFAARSGPGDFGSYVSNWASGLKRTISEGFLNEPVHRVANDQIWWGAVNDKVGYINVYQLTNFIKGSNWKNRAEQLALLDDVFDEIFAAFDQKEAILLDLSHNQGGFDAAGELIASRFADHRRNVLTVQPLGVSMKQSQRIFVQPSSRTRFTKPVYVLTSPVTVSAGEGLVAMLKAFPHVRQIGETTRGYLSGISNKPLPMDLMVSVTPQRWLSPEGHALEVEGNRPDIPLNVFAAGDLHSSYRIALDATVALITADLADHHTSATGP